MLKFMTGIQSNGIPHIGNIINIILPTISYINNNNNKNIFFFIMIADLHSLTNYSYPVILKKNIYINAAVWLSFNIKYNYKNVYFYRQSDIKEINELFWYLNCFYPFNRLKLSHCIKKNNTTNKTYNTGIMNYPILMASDILLYDIDKVIIGIDQKQHIEITRKIANIINKKINKNIFNIPKSLIIKKKIIPGIDGVKMSKSLNNIINIFENKDILEKQVMSIKTTNKSIYNISYKEIKNTVLLKIYKLITNKDEYKYIIEKIKNFNIGFYNIKKKLFNYILYRFSKERKKFIYYLNKKKLIKKILLKGFVKSKVYANKKINFIKKEIGLKI
ncbi:MAG: tryptophan--tRNA ligase [Candidatus Shikimatogenerans bostrichidophilus]|nr:MAG: tryptophan--tRNA ligase [Candidatus Shikimatogenerans bostrichidophilus]